ncbi:MAG: hypothetical protein ACD_57C00111G0002 [uncultured bacterium]|uniref:Uncharacterized protein n=1 Tax=Candidatus Woesebacteria bacterium RIFCSPLOWO2_01_FULL_39_21 TaxID=1802519 RepID=A0A1F8BF21_9BACT|nr:MAG: hypothetical protein ACD_57C00111G0002 [uncultured bacterium]OGM22520.1 MAG: hypothetical protein A2691_04615 [Candidatus Woesebacteria bacterium RIFCSPHIGHO2_01_FULL_39_23]OGM61965.1 MAG: hypothetical protein A2961_02780 [Candidatus Woesebacteria bacterium RIFCSPLOWO2_01_FULL_39_21]
MNIIILIKKKVLVPKLIWVVLCGLFIINISLIVFTSSNSAILHELENQKNLLEKENLSLRSNLVSESSLTKVFKEALGLGMAESSNVYYLNEEKPVALSKPK